MSCFSCFSSHEKKASKKRHGKKSQSPPYSPMEKDPNQSSFLGKILYAFNFLITYLFMIRLSTNNIHNFSNLYTYVLLNVSFPYKKD